METRKERKSVFKPEKLDLESLVKEIDWTGEINQVMLVKAANKAGSLEGRKKYMANAESCRILCKYFESKFLPLIKVNYVGKDKLYSLLPGYNKEHVLAYLRGEDLKTKEPLPLEKKSWEKYYIPETPEGTKRMTKNVFPDNETLGKTAIFIHYLIKGSGVVSSNSLKEVVSKEFGWKCQRSIEGKPYTICFEVNRFFTEYFEIVNPIKMSRKGGAHYELSNTELLKGLKEKQLIVLSLIDDETLKKKITDIIEPKEDVVEKEKSKEKPEIKEETTTRKPEVVPTPEKPKIIKASPVIGKSEFKEIGSASPVIFEQSRVRWNKSLIAMVLKGSSRGIYYGFSDIANVIKKTRYVDISAKDIKDLCGDISRQFKGIFREMDFGGITIGSESLVRELLATYPQEKITETIFVRLGYDLDELQAEFPELMIKLASPISNKDNIFEIEMNRAERTEKAFARLVYKMRPGEIVLESLNNWVMKRTKILIDKLVNL